MSLLDKLERRHIDIGEMFVVKDKLYHNPIEPLKILLPKERGKRLLIVSGNKIAFRNAPNTREDYIWEVIHLVREELKTHPAFSEMRFVVLDVEHMPSVIQTEPHTISIAFSFRPDVRTYYSAIKMLRIIYFIFSGKVGGSGFESPNVYYSKDSAILKYCTCLNFRFFRWIYNDNFEDTDYQKFKMMFDSCGLKWDNKNHKQILKDSIARIYDRESLCIENERKKRFSV